MNRAPLKPKKVSQAGRYYEYGAFPVPNEPGPIEAYALESYGVLCV